MFYHDISFTAASTRNWAIPENIHTEPRTASMFYPPLAFRNSKMCYPPMPSEFHNRDPPLPFRISVFLEVHFRLRNAYMIVHHHLSNISFCSFFFLSNLISFKIVIMITISWWTVWQAHCWWVCHYFIIRLNRTTLPFRCTWSFSTHHSDWGFGSLW